MLHQTMRNVAGAWALAVCVAAATPVAAQATAVDALPAAETIVARHIEAIGGADAVRAVQSMHARGRLEIPAQGIVAALELFTARPARMLYRVTVPGVGRIENGYDGSVGWTVNPLSGPEVLAGRQLEEAAEDAWFDAPLHGTDRIRDMMTLDRTTFDDRPAWRIRVVFKTGREQIEYFDIETGLQIGSEASRATPQGIVSAVNIFRNYQKFGNLLQATTFVQHVLGFEQVVTLTSCQYDQVPDSTFALPAEVAALLPPR